MIDRSKQTEYGVLDEHHDNRVVTLAKGQIFSGYSVGIITIEDIWHPYLPGNVQNAYSYKYPVLMKTVDGLSAFQLFANDRSIVDGLINAANFLVKNGCRSIMGACGFFGNYQKEVANAVQVPVALSAMCQVPWVTSLLRKDQKIAVMSANGECITQSLFDACSITEPERLIVKSMRWSKHFSGIVQEDRGDAFENGEVRKEVVQAAIGMVEENPDIGAFLLECSDMPPYAADIQREVRLPVFDFITMANWLHNSTHQTPHHGWM
ncbi:MAG: aspartate/glutamate racemase family protein [Clostridiales bacterium]|nr:aspartate/glutamate racemase family protein [Clostridiales bacterium]